MTDHRPGGARGADETAARDESQDLAFAARVAPALQEPVALDAEFESRVMAAVREDAARVAAARAHAAAPLAAPAGAGRKARTYGSLAWWRRPRTMHLSPLGGLALAAAFAGVVALGTLRLAAWGRGPSGGEVAGAAAVPDTVQVVRFVFVDENASRVAVVGDFNGWNAGATPLEPAGRPGVWVVTVPLAAGRHEYAFLVDGRRWAADPFAERRSDEFDTESSVVTVGEAAR